MLIAAAWCLYGGTMGYPFLFDDHPNIRDNESIRSWDGVTKMLADNGRPVAMLTFAANYALSGNNVWSYHLVNLLIHCAAGLTLYVLKERRDIAYSLVIVWALVGIFVKQSATPGVAFAAVAMAVIVAVVAGYTAWRGMDTQLA